MASRTEKVNTEEAATAAAASRRSALCSARGAALATHSAGGIAKCCDVEATRLLRVAEGLCRAAAARLEHIGRSRPPLRCRAPSAARAPGKGDCAKAGGDGDKASLSAAMELDSAPPLLAAEPKKKRKRGKRQRKPVPQPAPVAAPPTGGPSDQASDIDDRWADLRAEDLGSPTAAASADAVTGRQAPAPTKKMRLSSAVPSGAWVPLDSVLVLQDLSGRWINVEALYLGTEPEDNNVVLVRIKGEIATALASNVVWRRRPSSEEITAIIEAG